MRCIHVQRACPLTPCVVAVLALGPAAHNARAQVSPPPAYRVPTIVIAVPADGTPLPEDKPVTVLRFMSIEPTDPIDALSFSVVVDGKDKTTLFQASQGEAWGPLIGPDETLSAGPHELAARICTSHGACATAKATVNVVASPSGLQIGAAKADTKEKKTRIIDALVQAIRVLFR